MLLRRSSRRRCAARFHLDATALAFNRLGDRLSYRDLLGGALVIGDVGSGKTTGIMANLLRAAHGVGASVAHPCVKPSDANLWAAIARWSRRSDDDIHFFRIGEDLFNPLAHEQSRGGEAAGLVENLTQLAILPLKRSRRHGGGADTFFDQDAARYVRHIVAIYAIARAPLSFKAIADSLLTLPESRREVQREAWRRRCPAFAVLKQAERKAATAAEREDLRSAARFLLRTAPSTPARTRASTVSTMCAAIDPLTRGVIGQTINASEHTWCPEQVVKERGVVILDCPLQVWEEVGAVMQRMVIRAVQKEVMRRTPDARSHIVLICADECQEFLDPEDDLRYLRTARDRWGMMLLATQCVGNIRSACGGMGDARGAAEAILGLPAVKLFGATTDPETMRYCSDVFTHTLQPRVSLGTNEQKGSGLNTRQGDGGGRSASFSRDWSPDVPPIELTRLKRGGPANRFLVEAFCSVSGRTWRASNRPSLKVVFPQFRM